MSEQEILHELRALNQKVDRLFIILESLQAHNSPKKPAKAPKPKLAPLTQEEMDQHQARFRELYEQWLSGQELAVQEQLDKWEVEELRRFADSNNLNVTSKMSKDRVLQLIGARFREKKQLTRIGTPRTEQPPES
jgi:hypothetical protein